MPQHKVQAGETLSGIASRYRVSMDAIKSENPIIKDIHHIQTGWTLSVPESAAPAKQLPPAQSANDDSTDDTDCSACQLECAAFLQVTDEQDKVYALTQTQFRDIEKEIEILNAPLIELRNVEQAEAGGGKEESGIPAAREKAWKELKELGALPRAEQSTTAEELLQEYEVKWQLERRRLEHQRQRQKRIELEIRQVRHEILLPSRHRNISEPRDHLMIKVFTTFCAELETTLPRIRDRVSALEEARTEAKQELTAMERRLKLLRAALEAEIFCRVAEQSSTASTTEILRLRFEADELRTATLWPSYINETDISDLVSKQKKLDELDDEPVPYMDYVVEYARRISPAVWLWTVIQPGEVNEIRRRQEERSRLIAEIEKSLDRLVRTSSATPVEVVAKPQSGSMKARPLVEVKHTGTGGYRYMRREVLEQLRQNWKPVKTSDVRAAMQAQDFKKAWGGAKNGLKTSKTLKLKFAEWKSKDDNFFNQLEVELLKTSTATEDGRFSASAEAQMFRFASQCGLEAGYDPSKKEAYIGGQLQGAYSLLQGEASLGALLPDETGAKILLRHENDEGGQSQLHCGYFRAKAEYKIQGFAGACASLGARAKVSSAPGQVGISGETNGEAFAGASLTNEAAFGVEWKAAYQEIGSGQASQASNGQAKADSEFKSLLDVKPEFSVSAGIGAGFDYKFALLGDKIVACLKGHLVLGPGGGGGVAAELNGAQVWELVKFVRWSLEQSDFRFQDWIDEAAFRYLSFVMTLHVSAGIELGRLVESTVRDLSKVWEQLTSAKDHLKDMAENVLANENLGSMTPGAKASLLAQLIKDTGGALSFDDPYRALCDEAAACILETVTSHREFVEVLKRMGESEEKGSFYDMVRNYSQLVTQRLYRSDQASRIEAWLSGLYS